MRLIRNTRLLLVAILASFWVSPCFTAPAGTGSTPPQTPNPAVAPSTPKGGPPISVPGAPMKQNRKAPQLVITHVVDWIKSHPDKIRGMSATEGGSELWMQYDFEMATKMRRGMDAESPSIREKKKVYKDGSFRSAADWVFEPTNTERGLIVELKVESKSNKEGELRKNVIADQRKVSQKLLPAYADYDVGVFALAWNPKSQQLLGEANMIPIQQIAIPLRHPDRQGWIVRLYVWTGELTDEITSSKNVLAEEDPGPLQNPGKSKIDDAGLPIYQTPQTPQIVGTQSAYVLGGQGSTLLETPSKPRKPSKPDIVKDAAKGAWEKLTGGKKKTQSDASGSRT